MSQYPSSPDAWNDHARDLHQRMTRQQRQDHRRAPLNIPTPKTTPELRAKWHGAPPSRPILARRVDGNLVLF